MDPDLMNPNTERDPRVYLALERTLLAWIRTSLAMMGFGFVVARFGLFLRELSVERLGAPVQPNGISTSLGIGLVMLGVLVSAASVIRYVQLAHKFDRGEAMRGSSWLAVALAVGLAVIGVLVSLRLMAI